MQIMSSHYRIRPQRASGSVEQTRLKRETGPGQIAARGTSPDGVKDRAIGNQTTQSLKTETVRTVLSSLVRRHSPKIGPMLPATWWRENSSAANQFAPKVNMIKYLSAHNYSSEALAGGTTLATSITISIISMFLMLLCISVLVFFLFKRSKKSAREPVAKEEDNPDYGTYYYADGDRRQDVMEVNIQIVTNYS